MPTTYNDLSRSQEFVQPNSVALRSYARLLRGWQQGRLTLHCGNESITLGEGVDHCELTLYRPWATLTRMLMKGDIGFAQAYENGWIDTPDMAQFLLLARLNESAWHQEVGKATAFYRRWLQWYHQKRDNTAEGGSRKNIAAHYDLGNDFYKLWLDETLSYSAALFSHPDEPLVVAQKRKVTRLLDQLALTPEQSLLEIGCGWGELMQQALDKQVKVTALTLSSEQQRLVQERLAPSIEAEKAAVLLQDYRLHHGRYDAIVSVEMFEAVGEKWWSVYFEKVASLLKVGGRFAMQSISIHPSLFENYRKHPDFIQRYIFPGGMLPTPEKLLELAEQAGLTLVDRLDFGQDYALTLRRWQQSFERQRSAIHELGIDDQFYRRWHYYLAYCEAGFKAGSIDVHQLTFVKD